MAKNAVNWFEIATTDIERAARFYERILDVKLRRELFGGVPHAIFPGDDEGVHGALVHDKTLQPGSTGTRVYLNAPKLDEALARTPEAGGRVVMPRTSIGKNGYIAMIVDTEGNTVALHTM
jgi:hypothetical protein